MLSRLAGLPVVAMLVGVAACAPGAPPKSARSQVALAASTSNSEPACGTEQASANDVRDALGHFDGGREVRAWVAMWNSFDLDQVDALFVRDARVTYFSSEKSGLISGIDALRQHHRGFGFVPGGSNRGSRLWLEAVQAQTYGQVVIVTATWFFQRAGSATAQRGPVTLVLFNEGAGCRIAHAHFANDPPVKPAPPAQAPR